MKYIHSLLLAGAAICAMLIVTKAGAQMTCPATPPAATPQSANIIPDISARTLTIHGQQVGEVLIGNAVVFRLRGVAAGMTPGQRATLVAARLTWSLHQGYSWENIHAARRGKQSMLLIGDNLLLTITPELARDYHTTPARLAANLQARTQDALRVAIASAAASPG